MIAVSCNTTLTKLAGYLGSGCNGRGCEAADNSVQVLRGRSQALHVVSLYHLLDRDLALATLAVFQQPRSRISLI